MSKWRYRKLPPGTRRVKSLGARPTGKLKVGDWAVMVTGVREDGSVVTEATRVISIHPRHGYAVVRVGRGEQRVLLSTLTARTNQNRRNGPVEHQPVGTVPGNRIAKRYKWGSR